MTQVNETTRDWKNVLTIPWHRKEEVATSPTGLTKYLKDAFEAAFHLRPMEVSYSSFPDGLYACLLVETKLEVSHNVWGIIVASYLHSEGIDVTVYVREASDYYPTEMDLLAAKDRAQRLGY